MDYQSRQNQLRTVLARNRLDALLVTHLPNIRYLCGFTGSTGVLLVSARNTLFFTDGRYTVQAGEEVQAARVVIARKPALVAAADWLVSRSRRSALKDRSPVGVEGQHLTQNAYRRLAGDLGRGFSLRSTAGLVEEARIVKDPAEIASMRAAAVLGAGLFERILQVLAPSVKETAVAAEVEYAARLAGAEGMAFPTIVVSGERSALPHGKPEPRPLQRDGFVVCDFGVILTGYCSDRTRTVYVGRPTREARRVYQAVRHAQQAAIAAVGPGRSVEEVDRAARNELQKQGLAEYFIHSTGHGVGLEIHEAPRLAARQSEILQPGMVITIEPGVYLPGKWGVRIEDMVLVTEGGHEVLAPSSTELIAV